MGCCFLACEWKSRTFIASCLHGIHHDICQDSFIFPVIHFSLWWAALHQPQWLEQNDFAVYYSKWNLDHFTIPLYGGYWTKNLDLHGKWGINYSKEAEIALSFFSVDFVLMPFYMCVYSLFYFNNFCIQLSVTKLLFLVVSAVCSFQLVLLMLNTFWQWFTHFF